MSKRNILLTAAAVFTAGYTTYRAFQAGAACVRPAAPVEHDAARYGATRRLLTLSGIARGVASSALLAYGTTGKALERQVTPAPVWLRPAAFAAGAALLDAFAELPIEFIEDHEVERRYGLSEQTPSSWLTDYVKQQTIGIAVTALLSGLLGAALRRWPRTWPYIATAAALPLLLIANVIVPIFVLPLFNTYVALEGPLEQRLRALAARYGVGDAQILRMNMSKQTKKANAFVIGIAGTHRIVVGDTLVDNFTPGEIEFVVAHELGHYLSKDTWRMIAVGELTAAVTLFGSFLTIGTMKPKQIRRARALAKIQFAALAIAHLLRPAISAYSRSREWAADRFAVSATGTPIIGAAAFRRLRDQNLAEDEQPAWYEFLFSTHPSLRARIAALENAAAKK